ncbi:MAG: HAD family hydrolase [Alicyclobacillus sp.]|nr:HAD family hydrolase [Alicyclobacillus sp.]
MTVRGGVAVCVRALLFDLDGTLLPFNHQRFMQGYFQALIPEIAALVERDRIVQQILQATEYMVSNEDPYLTNLEVFKQRFFQITGLREADIWPLFERFYERTFISLQALTEPTPIAREICRTAQAKGYSLVLATNPIFPEAAIRHRMAWAGIDDISFALITTMEQMHFCKPNPKYYQEIAERLQVPPTACVMFGNDVQEDGAAGKLGMQTYLVIDGMIDHGGDRVEFTYQGSLADALAWVQALPELA